MKVIISGGGTGGHIYPALAIASKIKDSFKDANILYIGTKHGLEAELIPKSGLEFKSIRVKGLPRKLNKNSLIVFKELIIGLKESKNILKDFKPDIVIGTGGYVCGPVVFMASKLKIPTMIHEQNAFPGITNKILSRYVDRVFITFDESKKYFKYPEKIVNTGNPIRKEILQVNRSYAYNKLDINPNKPFILSFGGSGGQKSLNEAIYEMIKTYKRSDNYQLMHVTGTRFYEDFLHKIEREGIVLDENIKILPYIHHMPEALNVASLVITSAGAITLAEISAVGIPSILIPKAYTAENHQEYNARTFEKAGASVVILENDLTSKVLKENLHNLLKNEEKLKLMSVNSKKMGKKDASSMIVKEIAEYLNKSNLLS